MSRPSLPSSGTARTLLAAAGAAAALASMPTRADLSIGNNPLYLLAGKANVLVVLDNSNSMDEAPSGIAAGSASAASKSEIARGVVRGLVGGTSPYLGRVSMGLMAYRQNTPGSAFIHTSPYDASYDPAHYDPAWTGSRASPDHKKFRMQNPSDPMGYIYYNVALPFYSGSGQGNAFCYSATANAANDFQNTNNAWDTYRCYSSKIGTSNTVPAMNGSNALLSGYGGSLVLNGALSPTDSDYAQGILDFGKLLTWSQVGRTWLRNDSPGRGYLHVPIKDLDATQATAITNKLVCNVPSTTGCNSSSSMASGSLFNAGLTPIEGTLLTARDYYKGGWSTSSEGYVAGCYPLPQSCKKNFVILLTDGLPSTDKNGAAVSNPTQAITDAAAAAAALKAEGVITYVIGFALPYGSVPASGVSPLDQLAAAGGSDKSYAAEDQQSLEAAFKAIFDDIFRRSSSFNSLAQNSTSVNADSRLFQARFDSTDWSGELLSLQPGGTGTLTQKWSTNDTGIFAAPASRKIYTYRPDTQVGVAFKLLTDLSTAQSTSLKNSGCNLLTELLDGCAGQARLDWLRGDRSKEGNPFRVRTRLLGDIVSAGPAYSKENNTVFAAANDGMLHAFNADTGVEQFAYIPSEVVPRLHKLTSASYAHEYFVDGEMAVSSRAQTGGKNILVGSLGRGGKSLYGLDVTTPASFGASSVLWEYSDADLGLVLGKPFFAKLNNGVTAVIVGNGYNSVSQRAVLYILNAQTGVLIKKIDTGAGSGTATNGLATPTGWDVDGSGTLDFVYAGDLLGNVWKFDLRAAASTSWGVYQSGGVAQPLFVAKDAADKRQPITGALTFGMNARAGDPNNGKLFVFFGTGSYITTSDVGDTSVQSWYGLIDTGTSITGRSQLTSRSVLAEGTISSLAARTFSQATAGDMVGKRGWVLDWKSAAGAAQGERIVSENLFLGTVLMSSSIIPSSDVCTPGGTGFINAIDPFSGAGLKESFFDVDGDGAYGDEKLSTVAVGSYNPNNGLVGPAALIGKKIYTGGSGRKDDGSNATPPCDPGVKDTSCGGVNPSRRTGRIAWREIVR